MPRVTLGQSPYHQQDMQIREVVEGKISTRDMNRDALAQKVGLSRACFYKRKKDPQKFTLEQLRNLFDALGIPKDHPARRI